MQLMCILKPSHPKFIQGRVSAAAPSLLYEGAAILWTHTRKYENHGEAEGNNLTCFICTNK